MTAKNATTEDGAAAAGATLAVAHTPWWTHINAPVKHSPVLRLRSFTGLSDFSLPEPLALCVPPSH